MKKAKSLQRFWAFLLVFVLVATTLGHDSMTVNAAEVQSVTEEAGEPESNTIEDKTGEETPAPSSDSLENEEKSEVPEGTQTTDEGTVDPSEDSTDTSIESTETESETTTVSEEDKLETEESVTDTEEITENNKVTYAVNFNISGEATVKIDGEAVTNAEVEKGKGLQFSVEADESKGYHIKEVKADGNALTETDGVYTLSNIEENVTVDIIAEPVAANVALYASTRNGKVTINPVEGDVYAGTDLTLTYSRTNIDEEDVDSESWEIVNGSEFATIDSSTGVLHTKAAGIVNVKVSVEYTYGRFIVSHATKTDSIEIQIKNKPVEVTGISITNPEIGELTVGDSYTFKYTISPENASNQSVIWSSSNEEVATVDEDGNVDALAAGNTTVTVKTVDGDFTDSVDVKVNAPSVSVESVKIEGADIVNMGKTITLKAVITPENGEVTETTWSSDNEKIAIVDEKGVVTGVSEGFATISVTINGNKTASHDIMVVDASSEKPMHTLTIKYQYAEDAGEIAGRTAASTYYIDVKEGSTYRKTSPAITGYTASQTVVEGQMPKEDTVIVVTYSPTQVQYTVVHKFENLDGTYSEERETKQGMFGSQTEAAAQKRQGFEAGIVDNTLVGNNTVIEIVYSRIIYTVRFDSVGGNYITALEKPFGSVIDLSTIVPAKNGYNFEGWYLDNKPVTNLTVEGPVELTAKWALKPNQKANYSIVYWVENVDGTGYDFLYSTTANGVVGTQVTQKPNVDNSKFTEIGLEAKGFDTPVMETGKVIELDGSTVVNVKLNRKSFKVTFYLKNNRGNWTVQNNLTITAKYGEDVSSQWGDAAHSQYMWYTSSNLKTSVGAMKTMPAEDVVRYGNQVKIITIYYKTENLNGSGYSEYMRGTMPSGWTINEGDIIEIEGFTYDYMNKSSQTLYYSRNSYNVTYNLNAADASGNPGSQKVKYEATFTKPGTVPTREGYRFTGWYYDTSGQSEVNFGRDKMPAHNITVYAGWEINKYDVIFDQNYSNAPTAQRVNVPYKEKVGQPASPEREGYDFQGWYTAKDGGAKYDFGTPVTKGFTLYAHWSPKLYTSYTVKYLNQDTGEELSPSVTRENIRVGKKVTEWAVDIEEFVPDEAMKQLDLAQTGNEIVFYYSKPSPREYTIIAIEKESGEELKKTTDKTMSAAIMITAPDLQSEGYVLADGQDENMYVSLSKDSSQNVFKFYYEKQKVTYQVHYYLGDIFQSAWTESDTVVNGMEITSVIDKCPNGYHEDKIVPELPTKITSNNKLIEVYYVENEKVTINYKAKTGGSVSRPYETLLPVTETAQGSLATASAGYHFEKWTDEKGSTVSTNLNFVPQKVDGVNVAATYYAVFVENENITINYQATAGGSVSRTSESLAPATGTSQGSIATASAGYHFVKWTDKDGNTVSTTLNFVPQKVNGVNVPATYTANFVENDDITINYVAHTGGSVSLGSETIAPVNGTAQGSTAIAANGYTFEKWTNEKGDIVGTNASFTPEKVDGLNVAATYEAHFKQNADITITYVTDGEGTVVPGREDLAPATGVAKGSLATPNYGYKLENWTNSKGEEVGKGLQFIPEKVNGLNVAETYTAHFVKDTTITKTISYSVEYWLEGESTARDSYKVSQDVWVYDDDTLNVEDIEQKEYPGYSYSKVEHVRASKGLFDRLKALIPSKDLPETVGNGDVLKVLYTENSVTINYTADDNGSVTNSSETIKTVSGKAAGSTAEAAKGYHFVNWKNAGGTVVSSQAEFVPEKVNGLNVAGTYTAYFEENNKITINYIANKGGVVSEGSETLSPVTGTAEGSKATASLGYRFVNWTDSEGNEVGTAPEFIPEKVDGAYEGATYYANFDENEAVTINYEARTGGSVDESSETLRPATGTATGSTATAAAGYTFVNWTDKNNKEVSTNATFVPAKVDGLNVAATYYANFKENESITINYVARIGGSVNNDVEILPPATGIAAGATATAGAGYTFKNWTDQYNNEISTDPVFVPAKVNGLNVAATYYANFEENKEVTINYVARTGGSVDKGSETLRPVTGTATGSTATAAPGYTFVNWTDENKKEVSTDATFVPAKVDGLNVAATYYANFVENAEVTINYVARIGGNVNPTDETLAPATGIAKGSTATAAAGYTFKNWTDADDNVLGTDVSFTPVKVGGLNVAATYYANFEENEKISIIYLADGNGIVDPDNESLAPATGIAEGSTAKPDYGYKLTNWTNSKGDIVSEELHFIPEKVDNLNVADTYTAHFEEDMTITKTISYGVEYWVEGETDARDTYEVSKDVWVNDPDTLDVEDIEQKEYPGYSYDRVELVKAERRVLDMLKSLIPSEDIPEKVENGDVLKVIYTENEITINYVADGSGSVSRADETLLAVKGEAQGSTATAVTGYHFVNWTNNNGDIVSTDATYVPAKVNGLNVAATYTAHFAVDTVTPDPEPGPGPTPDPTPGTPTATTAVLGEALAPVQPEVGVLGEALPPEVGVLGESKGPGTGDTAPIAGWSFLIMGAILTLGITAKKRKKEET